MERGKILESSINLKMDKSVRFASQDNFKSLNLFQRSAKTLRSVIGINEKERERERFFIARKGYCGFDGPRGKFFGTRSRIDTELTSRTT